MDRIRVRYVLTGACLPAYSGRVVHAIVPTTQSDGSPTTIACLIQQFRTNWPADMKDLADAIVEAPIKVLKTGRVLGDEEVFEQQLNASEKETCHVSAEETVGDLTEELQKPSVVLHMVIQKNRPPPPVEEKPKKEKSKSSVASDGANSGEGREVKKNSCCCAM